MAAGLSRLIVRGSAHAIPLRDQSVQAVVTSPPYFGLRQYAGAQDLVWGGDPGHEHEWGVTVTVASGSQQQGATSQRIGRTNVGAQEAKRERGRFCACGAWYGALGLELTPDCGAAGKVRLRRDLTPAQREYVVRRLLGVVAPDAVSDGTAHTKSRRSQTRNGGQDARPTT